MRLCSFLLASLSAFGAELTFSSVTATSITDGMSIISWATTGSVNASKAVAWDTNAYFIANGVMRYKTMENTSQSFSSVSMPLTGLQPSTEYVACPAVTQSGGANASVCTSAGASSSRVTFTTTAATTSTPTAVDVSSLDTTYPASFGATLTVANDCSDLGTKITAALSATYAGQNVKVVTPADAVRTGTCTLPTITAKSGGTHWVVIQTGSTSLPSAGVRVGLDHAAAGILTTIAATSYSGSGVATMALDSRVRFQGIWFKSASSAAAVGAGDPQVAQYIFRFDGGISNVIWDQCVFGQPYPTRTQYIMYGFGSNLGIINSTAVAQIWKPWISDYTLNRPDTATISVSGTTYVGMGNRVCTLGAWSAALSGSVTTTGIIYVDGSDCSLHLKTAAAITTTCSGITCETDAGLTVPSTGRTLSWDGAARTFAITNSTFKTGGGANTPTMWDNNAMSDLNGTGGSPVESEWNSHLLYYDRGAGANENHSTIIIQNNDCQCSGIDVFFTPTNVTLTNVLISGNIFTSPGNVPEFSATAPPSAATRRFHIELKSGAVMEISGNVFGGGYVCEVNTGAYAISIKNDAANGAVARVGDLTITNNWVINEPAFVYTASMVSENSNYLSHIERVSITNNLVLTDPYSRRQAWVDPTAGTITTGGIFIWRNFPLAKLTVSNNTAYRSKGSYGNFLLMSDGWGSGLTMNDNVFVINSGVRRGVQTVSFSFTDSIPAFDAGVGNDGTAALAKGLPTGYTATGNTIVSGCLDSYTCTDSTASGSLVGDLSAQYPAATWFYTGDLGTRLNALAFADRFRTNIVSFARSGGGINASAITGALGQIEIPRLVLRGGASVSGGITIP